jgi:hypothetical protein
MPFPIEDRIARQRLESRAKPYFTRLSADISIGYRRGKTLSRWVVQRRHNGRAVLNTLAGVVPDDQLPADGLKVLAFQQAVEKIMQTAPTLNCSFCGKSHTQVDKLIAGPKVLICDQCVRLCQCYLDYPDQPGKLLVDDGKPVMKDGKPVFVPLTPDEEAERQRMLAQ